MEKQLDKEQVERIRKD